jgi:hypothetical protein
MDALNYQWHAAHISQWFTERSGRDLDGKIYGEFPNAKILASPTRSERLRRLHYVSMRDLGLRYDNSPTMPCT